MIPHWGLYNYCTKVHRTFLPNAGGIAVDRVLDRFWISSFVLEIFAIKVWSWLKSGQILHVFGFKIFWGEAPLKFWTKIIKLNTLPSIVQNFAAIGRRSSKTSRWKKCQQNVSPLRKLSFPGRLIRVYNIWSGIQPRNRHWTFVVLGTPQSRLVEQSTFKH